MSDQVVAALEWKTVPIAPETAETILTTLVRFRIDAAEAAREIAPLRTAELAAIEAEQYRAEQEVLREALVLRDREVARRPLQRVLHHLGISVDDEEDDYRRLAMQALRVIFDSSLECMRRYQGIFDGFSTHVRTALRHMDEAEGQRRLAAGVSLACRRCRRRTGAHRLSSRRECLPPCREPPS